VLHRWWWERLLLVILRRCHRIPRASLANRLLIVGRVAIELQALFLMRTSTQRTMQLARQVRTREKALRVPVVDQLQGILAFTDECGREDCEHDGEDRSPQGRGFRMSREVRMRCSENDIAQQIRHEHLLPRGARSHLHSAMSHELEEPLEDDFVAEELHEELASFHDGLALWA
jgi:hypothetical protein